VGKYGIEKRQQGVDWIRWGPSSAMGKLKVVGRDQVVKNPEITRGRFSFKAA
jgi:hypothetical protein